MPLILLVWACAAHRPVPLPLSGPLDAVAFLAGEWRAEGEGTHTTEGWTAPAGGLMLGHAHTLDEGGATVFFEQLSLLRRGGDVVYRAAPRGGAPTEFTLHAAGPGWVEFVNPAHDFPRRIRYERTDGGLRATVDDGRGGGAQSWVYTPAE